MRGGAGFRPRAAQAALSPKWGKDPPEGGRQGAKRPPVHAEGEKGVFYSILWERQVVRTVKEVVAKIRQAEAGAEEARRAAAQKAKETEAEANAAGREALAKAKADAAQRAAELLEEARSQAEALVAEARQKAAKEGEALAAQAAARMDAAAALIVERIVGAK